MVIRYSSIFYDYSCSPVAPLRVGIHPWTLCAFLINDNQVIRNLTVAEGQILLILMSALTELLCLIGDLRGWKM